MQIKIYNYVKDHKAVSVSEIAVALNLDGHEVLNAIENLRDGGFLKMCPPIPLSTTNDSSCFYTITDKVYEEA